MSLLLWKERFIMFEPIQNGRAVRCRTAVAYGLRQTLKQAVATLVLSPDLMHNLQP